MQLWQTQLAPMRTRRVVAGDTLRRAGGARAWFAAVAVVVAVAVAAPLSFADDAPAVPALPSGWGLITLPGTQPGREVQLLTRGALRAPARYRVVVVPGSGCTGFAPFAAAYFAGLPHAEVQVLHKPGVSVRAGPSPGTCPPAFTADDALSRWQADAQAALRALYGAQTQPALATLLLGISEGGELLPGLAPQVDGLIGLVLLSSPGTDPGESGALQAQRLGPTPLLDWQRLERAAATPVLPDAWQVQGRSLRYWRDLFGWQVQHALLAAHWPLLQVWGDADGAIPTAAYTAFATAAAKRRAGPFCSWRMAGADHGLSLPNGTSGRDALWARLESWGTERQMPACPAESAAGAP